ncbi:LOW QUALITY PROTEIN: uncharacterized protein B0I36DRAFT_419749 [Microdochium trichocladiopsis]|uniref:Dilute domain-containing protein n=1 Tax=Microdochium trichocladiopsis TaxID=1682393 RepID=A0A9P8YHU8_9PEZI|nr:LOW QUALITY PROTEIN: uncharacterized protein B0I36DRAFT_419749 [Microdochium trichocladiopsis]KAH7040791.1 LOW QUALITY PROTEIN: hypothetical protein B0I36DRAFT_419749 [Microdochium trichocladiopsis]
MDQIEYRLEDVKATRIASDDIDKTFRSSTIDLISGTLGGKILGFSDEWFAEAANLVTPTPPIRQPGKMVYTGAWYDGWETRRHNSEPFDWVVIRLGVASGTVEGVEVDTAFFSGNHAPAISVEGYFGSDDDEVLSWKGGKGKWETILGIQECGPSQRFGWKLNEPTKKQYTHVRLNMYPDGGIARFRLFGHAVPVFPQDVNAVFDLAAAQNGAVAVSCSDQHFGTKDNLILPGRGKDMGDGWETARSRGKGHVDWAIIRLGAPAFIQSFIWKGEGEPPADAEGWVEVLEPSKCGPDAEHPFPSSVTDKGFTHVKLTIIPDGGVKRLRVLAKRAHGASTESHGRLVNVASLPSRTMDYSDIDSGGFGGDDGSPKEQKPRALPDDLPKSLDDRRRMPTDLVQETELYDGWQGQSQFLTSPIAAKPLQFDNLTLDDPDYDEDLTSRRMPDSDQRLMEMLAAQAQHQGTAEMFEDAEAVANDEKMPEEEKKKMLQKAFIMAASNGDLDQVKKILGTKAKAFVDINGPDEDGTPPLVYASCFGHENVVQALVDAGVDVDKQDRNHWSALMWAMTNRHKGIAKVLLDNGASPDAKTSSGRTAFDFVAPDSEMSFYLHDNGYAIGSAGVTDDFYNPGFSQDRFEEEMAENEIRRRMMMESARDLEVDLGNVGIDDQPEPVDEFDEEEQQEFDWTRCLHDQMFESELPRILDVIITNMQPQRSPSQKPVPANMIFLSARYAHYHSSRELLNKLLTSALDRMADWDMTILAFWMSNATLLLHYLKKDTGLLELAELINEIFILVVRDAERRLDKVLDAAMLEHETIPGLDDHEWKLFKRKKEVAEEPLEKRFRPPSPKRRAKPAPRNVTSLLSSTLFVLDLYDIHSYITSQIISQLLYWLGAELFNRIINNRKTKAMQIRMNVSVLEETNNRKPEHFERGEMNATGETTIDAAPPLLQWLQVFSSLDPDDMGALQLKRLIFAAKNYRPEVGEKGLPKSALKYLKGLEQEVATRRDRRREASPMPDSTPATPIKKSQSSTPGGGAANAQEDDEDLPVGINHDPAVMLPFSLPSVTDMLVSYGAGFGGVNRERERKYIPTIPPEFLDKLELGGGNNNHKPMFQEKDWENEEV